MIILLFFYLYNETKLTDRLCVWQMCFRLSRCCVSSSEEVGLRWLSRRNTKTQADPDSQFLHKASAQHQGSGATDSAHPYPLKWPTTTPPARSSNSKTLESRRVTINFVVELAFRLKTLVLQHVVFFQFSSFWKGYPVSYLIFPPKLSTSPRQSFHGT